MNNKKCYKYNLSMWYASILSVILLILPVAILLMNGYMINISFGKYEGLFIFGIMIYLVLHELCHGLGYYISAKDKKNIKFGAVLEKGVLYAMCQEPINKKKILISLVLPIIILTIIPLPFAIIYHIDWLLIYAMFNLSGAAGDILMGILIAISPKDVEYLDYDNEIGLYLLSDNKMKNLKILGFKILEEKNAKDMKIDYSIKRIYISNPSKILILLMVIFSIIMMII